MNPLKVGLVLSGGMSKGAYEIGFCKALIEQDWFEITAISSASIGTLNAYACATGKVAEAEHYWKSLNLGNKITGCRNVYFTDLIYTTIESFCSDSDAVRCPLYTVLWDISDNQSKYIDLSAYSAVERTDYLKAAVTVCPFMKPYFINHKRYFDGAIIENTPLRPVLYHDLDLIIVVQFDNIINQYSSCDTGASILYLNLEKYHNLMHSIDFSAVKINEMLDYGYHLGCKILLEIKEAYEKEKLIEFISRNNDRYRKRIINGDYLVRRLNTIMRYYSNALARIRRP